MTTRSHRSRILMVLAIGVAYTWACGPADQAPEPAAAAEGMTGEASMHQHHGIDYIEIQVIDMAEAKRFYGSAFGWEFTDYGPAYAGIRIGDREVGGFSVSGEVSKGGPLVVLYSEALEETRESVTGAGGKIVKEPFEFPGGRRFHFVDPSGNEMAVWSEK